MDKSTEYEPILDIKDAIRTINRLINEKGLKQDEKDALKTIMYHYHALKFLKSSRTDQLRNLENKVRELGEDLRKGRKEIKSKKVLIGFNYAVALMNKHFSGEEK